MKKVLTQSIKSIYDAESFSKFKTVQLSMKMYYNDLLKRTEIVLDFKASLISSMRSIAKMKVKVKIFYANIPILSRIGYKLVKKIGF